MSGQFEYTRFDERDRYEYLIRPKRINNGVTPVMDQVSLPANGGRRYLLFYRDCL